MSSFVNSSSVPDKLPLLTILETLYSTCNSHIPTVPALPTPTCDYHEILSYIAALLNNLLNNRNDFSLKSWQDSIVPYLTAVTTETIALEITAEILSALLSLTSSSEDYEDETDNDPATDLCNIEFNLAFGGKILLHQTKLHLKRGRRYGLVGRNGAGKTTLMTSISKGKLDGWPQELLSYYLDSGSNVDVSWEEQNVLKHLAENNSEAKAIDLLESLNFTTEMVNGKISELSGGWQMKLRLLKAVLLQPDILLLDEPTNHLDSMTVTWLEGYLKSLTNTTTIMVSHDTTFMENLCTDIVHYEKRDGWAYNKLVNYRGKMSYFVEKQPQAKHYFELATSELKFKFPEPGKRARDIVARRTACEEQSRRGTRGWGAEDRLGTRCERASQAAQPAHQLRRRPAQNALEPLFCLGCLTAARSPASLTFFLPQDASRASRPRRRSSSR